VKKPRKRGFFVAWFGLTEKYLRRSFNDFQQKTSLKSAKTALQAF
jgi:hypothetical protein